MYLNAGIPSLGAGRDHLLNVFDVAIALGTLPQHDCAAGFVVDMARRQEWQSHHVQRNSVLFTEVTRPLQIVGGPSSLCARVGGISADVVDPMSFEVLQHPGGRGTLLGPHVHLHRLAGTPSTFRLRRHATRAGRLAAKQRGPSSHERDERPSLHHDGSWLVWYCGWNRLIPGARGSTDRPGRWESACLAGRAV